MGKLYHEIKAKPVLFKDFPADFDPRHAKSVGLLKVPGGWTIANRSGLTRMMCDVANIGWMRHHDDVVRDEAGNPKRCHDPIVSEELFWYVYRRHARYLPDGSLNPDTQKWRDRKRIEPVDAMLRPVVTSRDPAHYRVVSTTMASNGKRTADGCYAFYNPKDGINSMYAYVKATEVDAVFWRLLIPHLEATRDIERYAKQEEDAVASKERERAEIMAQIEACDSAVAKQQAKLLKVDSDVLIQAINEEVRRQLEEKARLHKRLETFLLGDTKYAEQMMEWSEIVSLVSDFSLLVSESTVEERQQLSAIFALTVHLELLSPRVLRMTIHWRIPDWNVEQAMWLSGSSHGQFWTDEERERFLEMVGGQASELELMRAFPTRSWQALRKQATNRGLCLSNIGPLSDVRGDGRDVLCWQDWQWVSKHELEPAHITSTYLEPCQCTRAEFESNTGTDC